MTSRIVVEAIIRRWYLAFLGILLLAGIVAGELRISGVYSTRFDLMLRPPRAAVPSSLGQTPLDLSGAAAVMALEFNHGRQRLTPASPQVSLVDEGVRRGAVADVRNYGGQWTRDYSRPMINVQVVGPDARTVARGARRMRHDLIALVREQQARIGLRPAQMITAAAVPTSAPITYRPTARARSVLATLAAGSAVLVFLVAKYDAWARRRRRQ